VSKEFDIVVIGAGAAGLMTAIQAAKRGLSVVLLDHANKPGKKILMSGGGRCNFTNLYVEPENYLSSNPHFCKSALAQYSQWDFIAMVGEHGVPYHEKENGQLFCDNKAKDILKMLLTELENAGAQLVMESHVSQIKPLDEGFDVITETADYRCKKLVIATGGLSIPTMGASGFGYEVAQQFGHTLVDQRAGLVPFTFSDEHKAIFASLSGTSITARASFDKTSFYGQLLFTHRGLSGPIILQISSYWREGETFTLDLLPSCEADQMLLAAKEESPKKLIGSILRNHWPKSVVEALTKRFELDRTLGDCSDKFLSKLGTELNQWELKPAGTEGYRTAEVTLGGVSVEELSSKTMESKLKENLYFVGEVIDVTGHLGGFNFQWAWASAYACAQAL